MSVVPYRELLKDPRWQKKRLEVMNAANWKCQTCGDSESTLHAHHPKYQSGKMPWEYDDILCLCETCHEKIHDKGRDFVIYADPEGAIKTLMIRVRQVCNQDGPTLRSKRLLWEQAMLLGDMVGIEPSDEDRGRFLSH